MPPVVLLRYREDFRDSARLLTKAPTIANVNGYWRSPNPHCMNYYKVVFPFHNNTCPKCKTRRPGHEAPTEPDEDADMELVDAGDVTPVNTRANTAPALYQYLVDVDDADVNTMRLFSARFDGFDEVAASRILARQRQTPTATPTAQATKHPVNLPPRT